MNYLILLVVTASVLPSIVSGEKGPCPNMTLMEKCQRDAEDEWDIDRNSADTNNKAWCCHQWQAYDCQYDLGTKCVKWELTKHNATMLVIKTTLEKTCSEWPQDKCSGLKWWAITLIVIGSLVGAAIIGFLVFVLIIRRRSSRRYSAPKG